MASTNVALFININVYSMWSGLRRTAQVHRMKLKTKMRLIIIIPLFKIYCHFYYFKTQFFFNEINSRYSKSIQYFSSLMLSDDFSKEETLHLMKKIIYKGYSIKIESYFCT